MRHIANILMIVITCLIIYVFMQAVFNPLKNQKWQDTEADPGAETRPGVNAPTTYHVEE